MSVNLTWSSLEKQFFPVYHWDLIPQDYRSPAQGWELHVGEVADFLLEYWKAEADELPPSGGRRTVELQENLKEELKTIKLNFTI